MRARVSISDGIGQGRDNFLALRHVLAGCVLVSHAFFVVNGPAVAEPLLATTGLDLGQHAVNLFFTISGFLVVQSLERRGLAGYGQARALRLFPGLAVAVLVAAFVIGPLATTLGLGAYFRDPRSWLFIGDILPRFDGHATLPGVFGQQPASEVMITIWTIKYEIACYVLLAIGGVFGLTRRRAVLAVVVGGFLVMLAGTLVSLPDAVLSLARFGLCFAIGVAGWLYREELPLRARYVLALAALAVLFSGTRAGIPVMIVAECYGVLWLAFLPFARDSDRSSRQAAPDLSYGIYLYGFPLEQFIYFLLRPAGPWELLALALPATLLVAALSWYLVEKPALSLKARRATVVRRSVTSQSAVEADGRG
ncbi:acyltransferase family protein [Chelatococcus sp. GCM10030263]|uniref:acyltransferase family protein n=1 Tax=Chelatococcus sp. GCM10030263 TaxID=3273387 RepID=UPI0036152F25